MIRQYLGKGQIGIAGMSMDSSLAESSIRRPMFLLTVDTEEEWDWSADLPKYPFSTNNIEQVPEFQNFCTNLGVKPTYFVDYAVADHKEHVQLLNEYFRKDECDYGAHLHPWTNPPY